MNMHAHEHDDHLHMYRLYASQLAPLLHHFASAGASRPFRDVKAAGMAPDVTLNPADCSLDCHLQGHLASTLSDGGFGYLWSGGYSSA
jgi:hypothetical protein